MTEPTSRCIAPLTPVPTINEDTVTKRPIMSNDLDDDNDLVFPPMYEEDIEVIKQVDSTNISLHKKEAIWIVIQDCLSVAVQLQQAWEPPP